MTRYDHFSYDAACPGCGKTHAIQEQTNIAADAALRTLGVGDEIRLSDDLDGEGYVQVAPPDPSGTVRFLEDGRACSDRRFWTELTIARGRIESLRLVELDLAQLARTHYLCDGHCLLWDWARGLPDPGDWNDDLYTRDRLRRLRLQLMLREPLAARNRHEARMFIKRLGCPEAGSGLELDESGGRRLWRCACRDLLHSPRLELRFALADEREVSDDDVVELPGGPSTIVPPDWFRHAADEASARAPSHTAELPPHRLDWARSDLGQAIVYLGEVLKFIPEGEALVPVDAFRGDDPRSERENHPRRYQREAIEETRARWQRDLDRLGEPLVLVARSAEEADLYMELHRCYDCGEVGFARESRIEESNGGLVSVYEGACTGCGAWRRFEFRLSDELPPPAREDAVAFGDGRSRLLDPGELLDAASRLAARVPADPDGLDRGGRGRAEYALMTAIGALDEVLKFIPDGADAVPEEAFTSRPGWAVYDAEPGRFGRARLEAVRGAHADLLARMRAGSKS